MKNGLMHTESADVVKVLLALVLSFTMQQAIATDYPITDFGRLDDSGCSKLSQ